MKITIDSTLEDLYQTGRINVRIYNGLCHYFRMAKPHTIGYRNAGSMIKVSDICELNYHKLRLIRNLGINSVNLLCATLTSYGFAIDGYGEDLDSKVPVKPHKMSPAEFRSIMKRINDKSDADPEAAHVEADDLMCELLNSLGYNEGVTVFEEMYKHY